MKIEQNLWSEEKGWSLGQTKLAHSAHLVLLFGDPGLIKQESIYDEVKRIYPQAYIFGCSTSGNIYGSRILDDVLVATAVYFEHTWVRGAQILHGESSFIAGRKLANTIPYEDLAHVLVLSNGLKVNGSELMRGLIAELPPHVAVTGGLAGDGTGFQQTYVLSDSIPNSNVVAILGLYGNRLKVAYSTQGGWDSFGPERLVTKSKGNVLYEMDGCSALELYKRYLGDLAQGLPATGLCFPLNLRNHEGDTPVIRAILGINEDNSMVFAGDVPEGTYVRLMKANFDRLVYGAFVAAEKCKEVSEEVDLALLISCMARRYVLKQRTEEEVEAVQQVFGDNAVLTGFYSFGEICPHRLGTPADFHNQSMTITTFTEE